MNTQRLALAQTLVERALLERGLTARKARSIAAGGTYAIVDGDVMIEVAGERAAADDAAVRRLAARVAGNLST